MSTEQTPIDPEPLPHGRPHSEPQGGPAGPGPSAPPPPSPPSPSSPSSRGSDFFGWIRGLGVVRGGDRWMGGVASGLAHRWGVDPVLVRGLFIVAAIFLGVGVLAYGILWLLLPEPDGRIHLQEAGHGRWSAGMTGGLIVSILGLGGARAGFWFGERGIGGAFWGLFWVAVVAFGIYSIVRGSQRRSARRSFGPPAQPGPGAPSFGGGVPHPGVPHSGVPQSGDAFYAKAGTTPSYSSGARPADPATGAPGQPLPPAPPYYGGTLPPVPAPPRPGPPRRRGPSAPFVLVVMGAAVLIAGILVALTVTGSLTLAAGAVWVVVAMILGAGILVAGLRGRTAGILTLFAIVALLGGAVSQGIDRVANRHGRVDYAPASVQQAAAGYDITVAQGAVDLSSLDDAGPLASEAVVPVKTTMSDVTITLPKGVPVQVRRSATLSEVTINGQTSSGMTQRDTTNYNTDKPGSALVVQLDSTLSSVAITEER